MVLDSAGMLFDAQEWIDGEPLSGKSAFDEQVPNVMTSLNSGMLAALTDAVARFHRSTSSLETEKGDENKTLRSSVAELARYSETRHGRLASSVEEHAEGEECCVARRWLELLPQALSFAETVMKKHGFGVERAAVVCHGDLWAPHVYFSGADFVGFTDFESLHRGSPVSDLAQLILHFGGWNVRDAILDTYDKLLPLAEEDLATLPVAAAADLAFEGYWSLGLLYKEESALPPREKVAHETNLNLLLDSLELMVCELR